MLTTLRIRNLALVADLTLELQAGFNAITGETGAGKSVILGAIQLVLGQRADRGAIRSGADFCSVEAVFNVGALRPAIDALLEPDRFPKLTEKFWGNPDWAYISSGTWSLRGVEVSNAILTEQALRRNVTNEGGIDGTYRLLKNIMGLWLVQRCKLAFEQRGLRADYAELTRKAAGAAPFRSLVNPDCGEFLRPDDMTEAIAQECRRTGQPVPEEEGQFVRCALESLALRYRMVLGWLEELTGVKVRVIHVVGGGAQNALLNQFTADACGVPVIAGPVEATALGNVMVQAMADGDVGSLRDIRDVVRRSEAITEFHPVNTDAWNDAWERFVRIL